jgi:hypothetical protein
VPVVQPLSQQDWFNNYNRQ